LGGPPLYQEKKGKYTRLVGRHANYSIGTKAAERWVDHMVHAMQQHPVLSDDAEARHALEKYENSSIV
jgi:truncated hemoglobin YjbI